MRRRARIGNALRSGRWNIGRAALRTRRRLTARLGGEVQERVHRLVTRTRRRTADRPPKAPKFGEWPIDVRRRQARTWSKSRPPMTQLRSSNSLLDTTMQKYRSNNWSLNRCARAKQKKTACAGTLIRRGEKNCNNQSPANLCPILGLCFCIFPGDLFPVLSFCIGVAGGLSFDRCVCGGVAGGQFANRFFSAGILFRSTSVYLRRAPANRVFGDLWAVGQISAIRSATSQRYRTLSVRKRATIQFACGLPAPAMQWSARMTRSCSNLVQLWPKSWSANFVRHQTKSTDIGPELVETGPEIGKFGRSRPIWVGPISAQLWATHLSKNGSDGGPKLAEFVPCSFPILQTIVRRSP